jgi:pantoate--beta-alanine ligase
MEIFRAVKDMQAWAGERRRRGLTIGFVPTMGYLHSGHVSLMTYARKRCDRLVVSIFVNPTQFNNPDDLSRYPRDLERDLASIRPVPVDAVFHPAPEEMYPAGFQTYVEVTGLSQGLCGADRPGHFRGVTTVVAKLFLAVNPHLAVFGEKDFQQLKVIQRMTRDLGFEIEVVGRPTFREPDGLAMSSRNVHLKPAERQSALALSESLRLAQDLADRGTVSAEGLLAAVRAHIEARPFARVEYAVLVDPETLTDAPRLEGRALLALAVTVGKTRLIDNAMLTTRSGS